jgi:predicted amidohydrolase
MNDEALTLAVAKYPIDSPAGFDDFAHKQTRWLCQAAAAGARVAVLPEYLSLELAAGFAAGVRGDLHASLAALQSHRAAWCDLYAGLARDTGLHVVAGTFLLDDGRGRYRNRADLFSPDGGHLWQDKLQLTGFEKKTGVIDGGDALKVFEIEGLRVGIAVCYDIEFPLPVRAQCEAGARLMLVPSCTDTAAGATRVRVGCLARALENRCFVAQSVTAGVAAWSPMLDVNTGEATVYAPMDVGLPADGIVATTCEPHGWIYAEFDLRRLRDSRGSAQVANDRDWPGQLMPGLRQAKLESVPPEG